MEQVVCWRDERPEYAFYHCLRWPFRDKSDYFIRASRPRNAIVCHTGKKAIDAAHFLAPKEGISCEFGVYVGVQLRTIMEAS